MRELEYEPHRAELPPRRPFKVEYVRVYEYVALVGGVLRLVVVYDYEVDSARAYVVHRFPRVRAAVERYEQVGVAGGKRPFEGGFA